MLVWTRNLGAVAVLLLLGCSRDHASSQAAGAALDPKGEGCGHAACGPNYFVDVAPPADCASRANCALRLKLVATGDFHINAEYPYRFLADVAPKVAFQGTDPAGPTVFSKAGNNWETSGPQTGTMSVVFQANEKAAKTISGTFKLSVCSAKDCELEQATLAVPVSVH